jgi:hypothetical protein
MPRPPLHAPPLPGAPLAVVLAVVACVPKDPPDPGAATAVPDGSTGADGSTTDLPDDPTDPTTGDLPDDPTTGAAETTGEPDPSDSGESTGEPSLSECPYAPPGVLLALTRIVGEAPQDMSLKTCGTTAAYDHFTVLAAGPKKLELAACADPECGDCDPTDRLLLALSIPDPLPGLPPDPGPGACVRLSATWQRPTAEPAVCDLSAIALLRSDGGLPEPVPRFMYRHSETLPATDEYAPFALTAELAGPGDVTCPCDADCCDEPPGDRRVQFTAKLGNSEIGVPPLLPGDIVPAFAYGTPEGDDLFGDLALVRAYVPGACDEPAHYEWLMRVTP